MPDVTSLLGDPAFRALPKNEQLIGLREVDPVFAGLPASEQLRALEDVEFRPPKGLLERGNIDLTTRPVVQNPDGTTSTVRSMSFGANGREILIPTISDDARIMPDEEAIETYRRTGKHLGIFSDPQTATKYASQLHHDYESGKIKLKQPRATLADDSGPLGKFVTGVGTFLSAGSRATHGLIQGGAGVLEAFGEKHTRPEADVIERKMGEVVGGVGEALAEFSGRAIAQTPLPERVQTSFTEDPSVLFESDWWAARTGEATGSILPFLMIGMAAGKGTAGVMRTLKVKQSLQPIATAVGAVGAMSVVESAIDAGANYREAIEEHGASPEIAGEVLGKTFRDELAPTAALNFVGLMNPFIRSTAKRVGASMVSEMAQESIQGIQQRRVLRDVAGATDIDILGPVPMEALTALLAGGIGGAVVGARGRRAKAPKEPTKEAAPAVPPGREVPAAAPERPAAPPAAPVEEVAAPTKVPAALPMTKSQRGAIFARKSELGLGEEEFGEIISQVSGQPSTKGLTSTQADEILTGLRRRKLQPLAQVSVGDFKKATEFARKQRRVSITGLEKELGIPRRQARVVRDRLVEQGVINPLGRVLEKAKVPWEKVEAEVVGLPPLEAVPGMIPPKPQKAKPAVSPPEIPSSLQKQAFEMTRAEWMAQRPAGTSPGMHSWYIKEALREGKPVSDEVLASLSTADRAFVGEAGALGEKPEVSPPKETAVKALPPKPTGKQPWEMTRQEWVADIQFAKDKYGGLPWHIYQKGADVTDFNQALEVPVPFGAKTSYEPGVPVPEFTGARNFKTKSAALDALQQHHRRTIEFALKQGKPVPPEVLADYPDLQKVSKPQKTEPTVPSPEPTSSLQKQPWEMTREDLLDVPERTFPKGAYRGELHDARGEHVANVYLHERRGYVGEPRPYGRGEVTKMLPGSFEPKAFEKAGKLRLSAGRTVQFWKFRQPKPPAAVAPAEAPKAAAREEVALPEAQRGSFTQAKTSAGTVVETEYAVVDANQLVASHDLALNENPAYPQELQPRDRTRRASEEQVDRIARELDPEELGESYHASEGAPIVGPDLVVESGNARTIALQRVYPRENAQAGQYRRWLIENAERFRVNRASVEKIDWPVLVRIRRTEVDRGQFAREAGMGRVAAFSATEQARTDATKLTAGVMELFRPSESGEILTADNRDFVRAFFEQVIPPAERGEYMQRDGTISQAGARRIRNAIFAKAYGDIAAIEKLAEATDSNVRNVTAGILRAAPSFATLSERIAAGDRHDLRITPDVAAAARKLAALREQGTKVEDYIAQRALFEEDLTPEAKEVLRIFSQFGRSGRKIGNILETYARTVDALGNPKQEALFAGDIPTKMEVLQVAVRRVEEADVPSQIRPSPAARRPEIAPAVEAVRPPGEIAVQPAEAPEAQLRPPEPGIFGPERGSFSRRRLGELSPKAREAAERRQREWAERRNIDLFAPEVEAKAQAAAQRDAEAVELRDLQVELETPLPRALTGKQFKERLVKSHRLRELRRRQAQPIEARPEPRAEEPPEPPAQLGLFGPERGGMSLRPKPEVPDYKPKRSSVMQSVVDFAKPGERIIREQGEAGAALEYWITQASDFGDVAAGKRLLKLKDSGLPKIKDREKRFDITDALEGRAKPSDELAPTVKTLRAMFKETGDQMEALGGRVQKGGRRVPFGDVRIKDYYPRVIRSVDQLSSGRIRKDVIDYLVRRKIRQNPKTAAAFLDEYLAWVETGARQQSLIQYLQQSGQARNALEAYRKLTRHRKEVSRHGSLEFAREVDLPFYDPDPGRVLPHWFAAASERLERIRVFGQDNELLTSLLKDIEDSGGNAIRVRQVTDRIFNLIQDAPEDTRLTRFIRTVQGFKLGLAAIPNATQGAYNTMLFGDFPAVIAGFRGILTKSGHRLGVESGAAIDSVLNEMVRHAGSDWQALGIYLRATGFTPTERYNRIFAASAGANYAGRLAQRLVRTPTHPRARRILDELGIGTQRRARRMLEELGIDPEEVIRLDGKLSPGHVLMTAKKFSDTTQFRARPQDLPLLASSPWGRVFFQFKNFIYNQTRLVGKATIGEFRHREYGRLVRNLLVLSVIFPLGGEAIRAIRSLATGREEDLEGIRRYFDDIAQVGAVGILADFIQSAEYSRLLSGLVGPGISQIAEIGEAALRIPMAKDPVKATSRLGKVLLKSVPLVGQLRRRIFPKTFGEKKKPAVDRELQRLLSPGAQKYLEGQQRRLAQ